MKRKLWPVILILSLFWPVFSSSSVTSGAAPASELHELRFQERVRTYILHLPKDSPPGKMPLLIALHGYGDAASSFEKVTRFDAKADAGGFAVVYPNGSSIPPMWNAGRPYDEWSNNADDVGFISALIDTLAEHYPIDQNRVWVTGHSNGAYMVYRLARELSQKVAAIAPVAGQFLDISYLTPEREVAVLHIHALDDTSVSFNGGNLWGAFLLPVETTLAYWITKQKCDLKPMTVFDKDGVTGRCWKSPSGYGDVYLYTTEKGGHLWPRETIGGLEATDLISGFFLDLPPRK